jgi:hypothetical protein
MKTCIKILIAIILTTTAAFGQTTILWNESVNGELSGNSPPFTSLGALQLGTNIIIGVTEIHTIGNDNWISYPDFFTFEVPSNYEVTTLYIQLDQPHVWAWIGDSTFSSELAFNLNSSSGDMLSQWGLDSIDSGVYGMYLENQDPAFPSSIANYQLDFVVEPVPEPGTLGLLLLGASVFTLRPCRKSILFS